MAENVGSVYSEIRIRLDKLKQDIVQATSAFDNLGEEFARKSNQYSTIAGKRYKTALESISKEIKNVNSAEKAGAISTKEQIERLLSLRREELKILTEKAIKEGTASNESVRAINKTRSALLDLEAAQKKLSNNGAGILQKNIAGALASGAAINSLFRSVIQASTEYQDALAGVKAATDGTEQSLSQLSAAAIEAGDALGVSTSSAVQAEEALAKAGVTTKDIVGGALTGALTLAAAGTIDVADAAEIAASTMTQFGKSGEDVAHIADLLAAGAGKAQGEVSDLSFALKQAGLVSAQMGNSVEDTVGVLAAFASNGLIGSDAGTSFRTMLLKLQNQTDETRDTLNRLGIEVYDASGNFVGLTNFAGQLQSQLKNLTSEERNAALATVFGSDAIRAANILYEQGAEGVEKWTKAVNDNGFAARVAAIKLDTLGGDLKKLKAAQDDAAASIGQGLSPIFRGLTQTATGFFDLIQAAPGWLTSLVTASGAVALGIAGINAALVAMGITVSALTGGVGALVIGISALTAGAIAAGAAINEAELKDARVEFEGLGKATGVSSDEMDGFVKRAKTVKDLLKDLEIKDDGRFGSEQFKSLAEQSGLTNAQLANILLNLGNMPSRIRDVAKGFVDAKAEAVLLADQQKQYWEDLDDFWGKRYPKAIGKGTDGNGKIIGSTKTLTDKVKTLEDSIKIQDELFTKGGQSAAQTLKNKIALISAEIKKVEESAEQSGKLSETEGKKLLTLRESLSTYEDQAQVLEKTEAAEKKRIADLTKAEEDRQLARIKNETAAADAEKKTLAEISAQRQKDFLEIQKLSEDEISLIEARRARLLQVNAEVEQSDEDRIKNEIAINEDADKKISEITTASLKKRSEEFQSFSDFVFSSFQGLTTAIGQLWNAQNQKELEALETRYNRERELIENDGLTKREVLEKNLQDAIASGDAKAEADAKKQLELFDLEKKFQQEKAQLEYKAALSSWELQKIQTISTVFQAALNAFSSTAAIPIVGPAAAPFVAAGVAAGIGSLTIAAVEAAKPTPPAFATGGLVLPSGQGGRTVTVADQGGGEIMFGTGALGRPLVEGFADVLASKVISAGGGNATIQIVMDNRVVAENTVKLINDGVVRLKL